jgi:hypothetical protein
MSRPLLLLLSVAGLALNGLIVGPGGLDYAARGKNDFRHFYIGGRLVGTPGFHDVDRVLEEQRKVFGDTNIQLVPSRLPVYYLLFKPLSLAPYRVAYFIWMGCLLASLVFFVRLCPLTAPAALTLACCCSLPLVFAVLAGQDIPLVLLAIAGGLWALRRDRDFLAGILLSLCLIKPHLFVLLPLLVLGQRRWRLLGGLVTGGAVLVAGSFLVEGWKWPLSYAAMMRTPEIGPVTRYMPNLCGLSLTLGGHWPLELALSLAVVAMAWILVRRAPFGVAFAGILLGSLLLSHHAYLQDCAVLVPALAYLAGGAAGKPVRILALVLLLPLTYLPIFFDLGIVPATLVLVTLASLAISVAGRYSGRTSMAVRVA